MRKTFFTLLLQAMEADSRIVFITADMGYGLIEPIKARFPDRFFNTGAAEQLAIGMATGMAIEGKIPFVYSITPFLIFRPFEWIRNYLNHEGIKVILVGSGREDDYKHDGYTHYADEEEFMLQFKKITSHYPDEGYLPYTMEGVLKDNKPHFISLAR